MQTHKFRVSIGLSLSIDLKELIQPDLNLCNLVQQDRNSLWNQFLRLVLTSRLDVIYKSAQTT